MDQAFSLLRLILPRVISTFEDAQVKEGEVLVTKLATYIASWWCVAVYSGEQRRGAKGGWGNNPGAGAAGGESKRRRGPRVETVSGGGGGGEGER